ncbi:hypothetical protein DICPUDRAFT_80174 [Dictyostelium purpureum]|uniref:Prolyl 4-hydroxylase alpha subunit domain-containing protein n=1 Tax=Dictyostelium purpureum TaxID=5786 RepID=F0ZPQ8_DICPU|nr:uncharacterized protein DICPUDRAFT_80174 [Dictyostelium purpureum]EGC34077.1 hypothetical protein DICPUDRAFT_80174 [Dictyostelium purpureum]|eukprot:XP_003289407.1 hypothetical protein DICPUDRAFT_80174 [Dictyostelium purpureum]
MATQRSNSHHMNSPPECLKSTELKVEKKDLWGGGFLLYNVLSKEECNYFIEECNKLGWESLNWTRGGDGSEGSEGEKKSFRINDRIMVMSDEIAEWCWDRVKRYVVSENPESDGFNNITTKVKPGDDLYKIGSPSGIWRPVGLNPKFRMCRYFEGGLFKKHYDGSYVVSSTKRSLYTFMFYLNDEYTGGETNFLDDQSLKSISTAFKLNGKGGDIEFDDDSLSLDSVKVADRVGPSVDPSKSFTGCLIVFDQSLFHEGSPVLSGKKFIMRTDIMFEKVEDLSPEELGEIDNEVEAERILQMSEELERSGNIEESVKMYKKAFSLSKNLASRYGF